MSFLLSITMMHQQVIQSLYIKHLTRPFHLHLLLSVERLYLLKEFYDLKLGHLMLQHAIENSKSAGDKGHVVRSMAG